MQLSRLLPTMALVCGLLMAVCTAAPVRAEVDQAFKDKLVEVLKEHPEIVMEVIREKRIELLTLVEQAARDRRDWQKKQQLQSDMANPKDPELDTSRPFEGTEGAPVVIVEYTDFLCPYCSRASQVMTELLNKYPGKFQLFFKHQPLHDFSRQLAVTFEAIALQDEALAWKFRDMAFDRQADLGNTETQQAVLDEILTTLKVDKTQLEKDRKDPRIQKWLDKDMEEVQKFGLNGTPMFLVNGVTVRGAQPLEQFEEIVRAVERQNSK